MRAAGAETQRLPVRNWPQTHFHFQSMCISPQIHPQNVNVFDAYFLITVRVGRANSLVELPCWSSNGVPAWPVGHPREYQHDLLVVPAQRAFTFKNHLPLEDPSSLVVCLAGERGPTQIRLAAEPLSAAVRHPQHGPKPST